MSVEQFVVASEYDGVRLDRYVRSVIPGLTQAFMEKLLRKGRITLNDGRVLSSTRIKTGDTITVMDFDKIVGWKKKESETSCDRLLELFNSSVIYEDQYIIAINKAAGLDVQGGTGVKVSVSDVLSRVHEGECLRIVHRIDRATSGVLVLARNLRTTRELAEKFRSRDVHKEYIAVTTGVPSHSAGKVSTPIFYKKQSLDGCSRIEKAAETVFSVLQATDCYAMVRLSPVTGRKHQIRIHMAQIGCPILGDDKYGHQSRGSEMLHLHAYRVAFNFMGKTITISAPLPDYITSTVRSIFGEVPQF